jgi:hypothetical protein
VKRLLTNVILGFLCAALLLGIAVAADGWLLTAHWLRDIFIRPPLWLLQTGLPSISDRLTIQPGSPYGGAAFFGAFFMLFWWLISSGMIALMLRSQPPNNSFKVTPDGAPQFNR